jgi:hypothetical protein
LVSPSVKGLKIKTKIGERPGDAAWRRARAETWSDESRPARWVRVNDQADVAGRRIDSRADHNEKAGRNWAAEGLSGSDAIGQPVEGWLGGEESHAEWPVSEQHRHFCQ